MKQRVLVAALVACLISVPALALSPGDQYNLDQLRSGNPNAIRNAARNVNGVGSADRQVLDVMAEILSKDQSGDTFLDAQAWICKALANTPDAGRYFSVIDAAAKRSRKLERHCGKAAEQIGGAKGEQYVPGSASTSGGGSATARSAPTQSSGSYKPITELKVGMSQEQAFAIAGPPTSTSAYVTGKAFIPFNFKGADSHRTVAHYKGQGRVVFSNTSRYSSGMEISEIQVDPGSTGYQ